MKWTALIIAAIFLMTVADVGGCATRPIRRRGTLRPVDVTTANPVIETDFKIGESISANAPARPCRFGERRDGQGICRSIW
jgi:hypothetical protein